ncbi:DUF3037 domain-containing protein [Corynebacterium sp. NML130628]|uniref:DUF3037 domain-containing protein n=1 Tax=Corynebacterium sp. NML130628 TaxID=1906333 RepID=UPI0008FB6EF1|nr:DUF3037 domain-containing protein [Corynebacterium sp. NML130628]OIR45770.1 hypothetical protein BJP07_02595 [Corynebacterium sp. NML130628]
MRFDYWTVRAVPQPMGITTIGVGVIVLDPHTGQSQFRFKDAHRALTDSDNRDAIKHALQNFKNELEQLSAPTEPLYLGDRYSLRGYLTFVSSHWMNIIRVDQVKSMDAANISEATQLLFDTLIGGQAQSDVKPGVRQLKREIRTVYRSFPELGKATVPDADVSVARRELDLNLAVVREDTVLELNQAFNFQVNSSATTRSRIDAWTLKIDKLWQEGGMLKYNDSPIEISKDHLSITAVALDPTTSAQQQNYERFKAFCHDLNVTLIASNHIREHAESLNRRLSA